MHVLTGVAFRQQDVIESRAGFDHLDDIAATPCGAKTIDADGDAAIAEISPPSRASTLPLN